VKSRPALLLLSLLPFLAVPNSFAWGNKGHRIINRLAAQALPPDLPAFLRTPDAINEMDYLGPEPDRWRSRAEPELNAAQAPDHFIDLEYADLIGTLPRQRYEYIAALYAYVAAHPGRAADLRPEKVGFQPYITSEVWERLKSAMRDYRTLSTQHQDTKPVEAAILFYAGWLGHYVGDGAQPLHVTIQYNGWTGPNPNGYTTEHHIHSLFESTFVDAAVNASDVQPLMTPVHPIGDEWDDYLAYLRHTATYVEKVYQLDKAHAFDAAGTDEARQFTAERLAAGASMLRDLIVAAWQKSAEPVPDWHEEHENGTNKSQSAASPSLAGGVSNPVLLSAAEPRIPAHVRPGSLPTVVLVGLTIDPNGLPRNVHVIHSDDETFNQSAIASVRQYRFKPAMDHGKPIAADVQLSVQFKD
jgi:TonB family protein